MRKGLIRFVIFTLSLTLLLAVGSCAEQPASTTSTAQVSSAPEPTTTAISTEPVVTTLPLPDRLAAINYKNYPVVDGSTATIPLALSLIKAITGCSDAQAEESIAFNKTDPSYYALAQGRSDLLLVYAPAQSTVDELDVFDSMDVREIGLDALVFIVNEGNPVDSLTSEQIRDIYSGKITNWQQVGGEDIDIVPFQRPTLSGSQTLMLSLMMQGIPMIESSNETISDSMADIIEDIAAYDNSANAIGYSVYYYARNMYTQPGLKFIAVDGVVPSNQTINNRDYGYINAFYGIIPLKPKPEAEALLDFLLTPKGQMMLSECGYVPIIKLD